MINLVLYLVDQESPLIQSIVQHYEQDELFSVSLTDDIKEATSLATERPSIIVFSVSNKDHLTKSLAFLKGSYSRIKDGKIKTACFLKLHNKKIEKALSKLKCRDFLPIDINQKSLSFKINFWSKPLLNSIEKSSELNTKQDEQVTNKPKSQEELEESHFNFQPPLNLHSDLWFNKPSKVFKKVLNKAMIKLIGPCQGSAYWKEEGRTPEKQIRWKLVFANKEIEDSLLKEDGTWFFEGSKPEYNWGAKEWRFTGPAPVLYFLTHAQEKFFRFDFSKKPGIITESKEERQKNLEGYYKNLIKNSHQFKGKSILARPDQGFENDNNINTRQESDNRTENLDYGPLQGKSSTDSISSAPLQGKLNSKKERRLPPSHANLLSSEEDFEIIIDSPALELQMIHLDEDDVSRILPCTLVNWNKNEVMVITKQNEFNPSHVKLNVLIDYQKTKHKFFLQGQVIEQNSHKNGNLFYIVSLAGSYLQEFEKMTSIYGKRQKHINSFMKLAKG